MSNDGKGYGQTAQGHYPARCLHRVRMGGVDVTRLAALAAQYVGRRVKLRTGTVGTITRITPHGFTVSVPRITSADIEHYLD